MKFLLSVSTGTDELGFHVINFPILPIGSEVTIDLTSKSGSEEGGYIESEISGYSADLNKGFGVTLSDGEGFARDFLEKYREKFIEDESDEVTHLWPHTLDFAN